MIYWLAIIDKKIHRYVDEFSNFLLKNPFLPEQLDKLAEEEDIRPIEPVQLILNLSGLTTFPFIVRPVLENSGIVDEDKFQKIIETRKKMIPELILGYLKG